MKIEIINPNTPKARIPIADIFATILNSFFVGFLKTIHTLLHFMKKDLALIGNSFMFFMG